MKNFSILILIFSILFTSCASVFNTRYQRIVIHADEGTEILIDGEEPEIKNGKYKIRRNYTPKQLTFRTEGYKDENIVLISYKRPWLYYMSWVPFGMFFLMPPAADKGPKAFNYDREIFQNKTASLPPKTPKEKDIRINKFSVNLKKENIKHRFFTSYKEYLRKNKKKEAISSEKEEDLKIENTIFSNVLNEILAEKGYIDTTSKVLTNSYINNLLINAAVQDYTVHYVNSHSQYSPGGMVYVDLSINWEVLDFYEKPIYEITTKTTSGQFAIIEYDERGDVLERALKDVMENGLIDFMGAEKVKELLNDKESLKAEEEAFTKITIPAEDTVVSNLPQAIKSSLTVKTKKGFGSGFVISSNGYFLTNFHVISDTTDLKVVLNDGSEHKVDVVRVSKVHDLALLKMNVGGLIPFALNPSKDIEVATEIYAVGTPTAEDLSQTISKGIISGIRKNADGSKLIQTDASINSGNSGGPMDTKDGKVYGIVSSKIKGFSVEGVAFGIPAYTIMDKLNIEFK